jgi:hypothetical protein
MRRKIFNNFESLEELVYWMYNKIKNGSTGGGSGGITQTQLDNALDNKVDKISGKTLSSNDYTNDDKSKVGEISNKLDKGTYTGTAKDLEDSIEQIKTNSRSVSWADISNKPRVSVTLAENSTSRTYTIGLTDANGSSGKLIIPKAVSWNDVTDKPTIPILPNWVTQNKPVYDWTDIQNKPNLDFLPLHALNNTNDINTYLPKGKFFAAETYNTQNMPANDYFHIFGGKHTNPNNNFAYYFAIPFNNRGNDNFYFKNIENGLDRTWTKFIGFRDAGGGYQEMYNEHGYHLHYPAGRAFRVYQGNIGSGQLKIEVTENNVFSPKRIESASGFHFRGRSNDDVLLNNGSSQHKDEFFINRGNQYNVDISSINTFKNLPNGIHYVKVPGEGGCLAVFKTGSSANSIQLLARSYTNHRLMYNWTIDGNRYSEHNFRELAYYDDVIRPGIERYDWTATKEYQNSVVFIPRSGFIELNQLEHLSSISFRKTFDGGNVTFTCNGKQIIYTSGNLFNGGDGSTATVSIWNNKCYIDIRNI